MTEENKERAIEMFKMHLDGATYQEIADHYGISKQRVEQILKMRKPVRVPSTKRYEDIIYGGLKEWMVENKISIMYVHKKISNGMSNSAGHTKKKMVGKVDFTITEIKKIIELTGLNFEQLFM